MSGFFWTHPQGLWALATLAAVALLYIFYRRYRPLPVTGLFLWGAPPRDASGGRKARAPILGRAFLFDMLAAACFALALAGPSYRADSGLPMALILDDSFAMRSRGCLPEARLRAERFLRDTAPGRLAAVILAGDRPRVLAGAGTPPAEAAKLLANYRPSSRSGDLQAAAALARDLAGPALDLRIVTNQDALPAAAPDDVLTADVLAGRGDNLAFGHVWRTKADDNGDSGKERVILSLVAHAAQPVEATLAVALIGADKPFFETRAALTPGVEHFVSANVAGATGETLVATIAAAKGEDAIPEDSRAFLPPRPDRLVAYGLDGIAPEAARYFRLGLEAAGCRPLAGGTETAAADLLITNKPAAKGRVLTLEVPDAAEPGVYGPPFVVDYQSELCRDLDLSATRWTVARRDRPDKLERAFVLAGDTPLYWRSAADRLHLNLLAGNAELTRTAAWPVLLAAKRRPCSLAASGTSRSRIFARRRSSSRFVVVATEIAPTGVPSASRIGTPIAEMPGVMSSQLSP